MRRARGGPLFVRLCKLDRAAFAERACKWPVTFYRAQLNVPSPRMNCTGKLVTGLDGIDLPNLIRIVRWDFEERYCVLIGDSIYFVLCLFLNKI